MLLSATIVEATIASVDITWQLSSSTLRPSSAATISLSISNPGSDLTGVLINSTAGPHVRILNGGTINLGGISALSSSQAAISIKIDENAPSENSYVSLDVTYYTGTSNYEKIFSIPITITRESILQLENVNFSSPTSPGKTVNLTFELKNEGQGDARDIIVSLDQNSNFTASGSSGEYFISRLAGSQSNVITIPLTISPDAEIGTSTIPIRITYFDETRTNNYTVVKKIGVLISGKYNFIVTPESQDVLTEGRTGSITVKIANAGNQEARFIVLNSISSKSFDLSPTTIYIGNLNSDDYDSEKLTIKVGSVEPGTYPISFQISYKDLFGTSYNELYSVNAKISSKADYLSANGNQSPLPILIVAVIVVIVFVFLYKKNYLKALFRKK